MLHLMLSVASSTEAFYQTEVAATSLFVFRYWGCSTRLIMQFLLFMSFSPVYCEENLNLNYLALKKSLCQ